MIALAASLPVPAGRDEIAPYTPPAAEWPLMGDLATCRAGVPEAVILWRRARGEAMPDPGQNSS